MGEVVPLPGRSKETRETALEEFSQKKEKILSLHWNREECLKNFERLDLSPALSFGLESAFLSMLYPLSKHSVQTVALLMGSYQEIFEQAKARKEEGFTAAKLKIGQLSFDEATTLVDQLKDKFFLRIDVNRGWEAKKIFQFFSKYPLDSFDFVEEPFQNHRDLMKFSHPVAIDESLSDKSLSLEELEKLPTLKAVVCKPTLWGGMSKIIPLHEWAKKKKDRPDFKQ